MDNESCAIIYCRILITTVATLHLALSTVLDYSYGYVTVIFACTLSIISPNAILVFKIRSLERKLAEFGQINNRILKFLTRDRVITWNDIHYSNAILLGSINFFACYVNLAIRITKHEENAVYLILPTLLSFALLLLFLMDARLSYLSIKRSPRPTVKGQTTLSRRYNRFMNFLAERLVLIQIPLLIISFAWHYMTLDSSDYKKVGMGIVAANFIQYPLTWMISMFFHNRLVRRVQARIGKYGLHVYGMQYTMLLIISGLSIACFVLNLELNIKFKGTYNGYLYLIAPYLTFMVSMLQAFALAGHQSWKDFNARFHNSTANGHTECSVIGTPTMVDLLKEQEQQQASPEHTFDYPHEEQTEQQPSSSQIPNESDFPCTSHVRQKSDEGYTTMTTVRADSLGA